MTRGIMRVLRTALLLLLLAGLCVLGHPTRDAEDEGEEDDVRVDDPDVCVDIKEIQTSKADDPAPVLPPVGFLTSSGIDMTYRDHLRFEVKACSNAILVLSSTANPLAYPGIRLQIKVPESSKRDTDYQIILGENTDADTWNGKATISAESISMDCDQSQQFWLRWSKKKVTLGTGWGNPKGTELLSYTPSGEVPMDELKFAGIGSTYSNADWRFCVEETIRPNCEKADVTVAVDISMSMNETLLQQYAIGFIEKLLSKVKLGPDDVQMAFVVFNNVTKIVYKLNEQYDESALIKEASSAVKELGYGTCLGCTIFTIKDQIYTPEAGSRREVVNVLIVITDAIENDKDGNSVVGPTAGADNLKDARIDTYAFGMAGTGSGGVNTELLKKLAKTDDCYLSLENDESVEKAVDLVMNRIKCPDDDMKKQ